LQPSIAWAPKEPLFAFGDVTSPWLPESEGWRAAPRRGRAAPKSFTETVFTPPNEMVEGVDGKGPESKAIPDKTEKITDFAYVVSALESTANLGASVVQHTHMY